MTIDLSRYPDQLPDPSAFFVHDDGRARPVVVEHATGLPRFVVLDDGTLAPYTPGDPGNMIAAVSVVNPPGFVGFPDHDRSAPEYQLATHHVDPARYFVHFEAEHPLVVEHATGTPRGRIVGGKLERITS